MEAKNCINKNTCGPTRKTRLRLIILVGETARLEKSEGGPPTPRLPSPSSELKSLHLSVCLSSSPVSHHGRPTSHLQFPLVFPVKNGPLSSEPEIKAAQMLLFSPFPPLQSTVFRCLSSSLLVPHLFSSSCCSFFLLIH